MQNSNITGQVICYDFAWLRKARLPRHSILRVQGSHESGMRSLLFSHIFIVLWYSLKPYKGFTSELKTVCNDRTSFNQYQLVWLESWLAPGPIGPWLHEMDPRWLPKKRKFADKGHVCFRIFHFLFAVSSVICKCLCLPVISSAETSG